LEPILHPNDVKGCQDYVQVAATVGIAFHAFVAGKSESAIQCILSGFNPVLISFLCVIHLKSFLSLRSIGTEGAIIYCSVNPNVAKAEGAADARRQG
jgi:hypothetical protein